MKLTTRIFSVILAVVLLVSALPMTALAAGNIMYGIGFVNTDNLKLRAQATTASKIMDVADKGDCVVIVSKVGSWYKVIYNLKEGYMYASYLDVLKAENAELGYGKVTGTQVNLRTSPNTYCRIVGVALKDELVYIIGINNGWYKVIFKDHICYIRSDYVELTEIPYENEDSENTPLFFRGGKSTGVAPSPEALKKAEGEQPEEKPTEPEVKPTEPEVKPTEPEVKPTEPEVKPTEPEVKPTEPEVKPTEPEVKPTEPEVKPTEPEEEDKPNEEAAPLMYGIGFVTASGGLRLREKATTNSAIVDTAARNECVVVIAREGEWYKVNYNLKEGYMHSDYLSVLTKENAELGYGKFISDGTALYAGVGITYKVLDTAEKDEKAYIIGLNTGWYKVIFGDFIGYVPSNQLELTEVPYENQDSPNYPRFFRLGKSTGIVPSAEALNQKIPEASTDGERIVATAKKYLGVPYVWGGASPSGFDCSGLVYYVFRSLGYSMYRTPADQYRQGVFVPRSNLQPGDVVFFYATVAGTGISHVGIYIGNNQFIHSPNSRSVVSIASLDNVYWNQHYYGARRMTK
jgi:cell wall-associated NlpC family hydrolase